MNVSSVGASGTGFCGVTKGAWKELRHYDVYEEHLRMLRYSSTTHVATLGELMGRKNVPKEAKKTLVFLSTADGENYKELARLENDRTEGVISRMAEAALKSDASLSHSERAEAYVLAHRKLKLTA